jgi:glutathione S-transferase
MKLYNSIGPNPRVVRMFLAEKGLKIPVQEVDLPGGENRAEPYLSINPHGQTPALELEGGVCVSEIVAICEYIEEQHPEPALIGVTAIERAETRMWTRRVDLNICEPLINAFRYSTGLKFFQTRIVTVPEAADGLRKVGLDRVRWLNGQLGAKTWICGDRFTQADIHLYSFLTFVIERGLSLDSDLKNIHGWLARMAARPSAKA